MVTGPAQNANPAHSLVLVQSGEKLIGRHPERSRPSGEERDLPLNRPIA